ncbi:MAG TPA: DUF3854 domain-containing protein [Bryobacteraceae bacterium]|nr:DUF3854 domain-containing protein [Bryobacteraceae bacterium]
MYVPPGVTSEMLIGETPVVITEGEFKSLALWRLAQHMAQAPRWLPLGISGVWNWRGIIGQSVDSEGQRVAVKGPIPDLSRIRWQNRIAYLAFDSDQDMNENVQSALQAFAAQLRKWDAAPRNIRWPCEIGKGIDDYIAANGPDAALLTIENATSFQSPQRRVGLLVKEQCLMTPRVWPVLGQAAYHGLPGEVVNALAPHSEADPAALLVQFLTLFGNVIGRGPHWRVESTQHPAILFTVIVGETAKSRKGTSLDNIQSLYLPVDDKWARNRFENGLSTGEGLIWAVRDPSSDALPEGACNKTLRKGIDVDPGVADKRLIIIEPEFARVLSVVERTQNTLSPVLRNAWDGKCLSILTKRQAARCGEPHISIIAHITKEELLRLLTDTSIANGFANRFLFVCAKRSKFLPFGGDWDSDQRETYIERLKAAVQSARLNSLLSLNSQAREVWEAEYPRLTYGHAGLLGQVTSRSEAQVMRLAMMYSLLDCKQEIGEAHLRAGLALWQYCEDSCAFIFGDALGDANADTILRALNERPQGLMRAEINARVLQGHCNSMEISRALAVLLERGLIRMEEEKTSGRPSERYFSTRTAK